jgi:hypothetical protein
MKQLAKDAWKLLVASAAVIVATGWLETAKADVAYSYAQQQITGLTVTGTGLSAITQTGTSTNASAVLNGVGTATNDPLDTKQAYQGASPAAQENFFSKYSTQGGGTQAGDFTRGDALLSTGSLFRGPGMSAQNVAESIVSTAGSGPGALATGSGSWSFAGTFTTSGTSVTVSYNWANDILDSVLGPGASAQSSFKLDITIKDQHGHSVDASPSELNTVLSAPPNSPEIMTSGSGSALLSLAGLTGGDIFTISISGTELSSSQLAPAVPEPGTFVLAGMGGVLALAFHKLRRRARNA